MAFPGRSTTVVSRPEFRSRRTRSASIASSSPNPGITSTGPGRSLFGRGSGLGDGVADTDRGRRGDAVPLAVPVAVPLAPAVGAPAEVGESTRWDAVQPAATAITSAAQTTAITCCCFTAPSCGSRYAPGVQPQDPRDQLKELDATLSGIEQVLDLPAMRREVADLEAKAASPDLWSDPENAQRVTSRLSWLQAEIRRVETLRQRLDDAAILLELADAEDDEPTRAEARAEITELHRAVNELEIRTLLSGEYDQREALVTINSQAGGVDAADWAQMLLRMYLRWAERHGYPTEILDTSYAEEAGIKSATFVVHAPFAYGLLAAEHGTHRLVRISPFDNQARRQTSFAGVDVVPVVEQTDHIEIPEDEIRVDVFRSSGPGGQGVNTTDSAVRITHLPTGIVVTCQNERSQLQNRATAMMVLQARLLERRRQEEAAKLAALRGETTTSWGTQIRNYVLHPYQLVKDLRTDVETSNTAGVLDGEIDEFIDAGVRWRRTHERV